MWRIGGEGTSGAGAPAATTAPDWRASLRLAAAALLRHPGGRLGRPGSLAVQVAGLSNRAGAFDPLGLTSGFGTVGDLLVAPAARWDATWYLQIAHDGYADTAHAAFFPLYPFLARAVGLPFGSALVGGIVVSLATSLLALAALHRLALIEVGERAARARGLAARVLPRRAVPLGGLLRGAVPRALGRQRPGGPDGPLVVGGRARRAGRGDPQRGRRPARAARAAVVDALAAPAARPARAGPRARRAGRVLSRGWRSPASTASRPSTPRSSGSATSPGRSAARGTARSRRVDGARQLLSGSRVRPCTSRAAGGDPYVNAAHNLELFATLVAIVPMVIGALRRLPRGLRRSTRSPRSRCRSPTRSTPQPLMSLPRFALVLFPLFLWLGWWAARGPAPGRAGRRAAAGPAGCGRPPSSRPGTGSHDPRRPARRARARCSSSRTRARRSRRSSARRGAPVPVEDARAAVLAEIGLLPRPPRRGGRPRRARRPAAALRRGAARRAAAAGPRRSASRR